MALSKIYNYIMGTESGKKELHEKQESYHLKKLEELKLRQQHLEKTLPRPESNQQITQQDELYRTQKLEQLQLRQQHLQKTLPRPVYNIEIEQDEAYYLRKIDELKLYRQYLEKTRSDSMIEENNSTDQII